MGKQTSYFRGCKCRVIYITFYGIKAYKCLNNDCDNSECLLVLLTYKSIYCLIYIVYKLIFMLLIPKMNRGMICEKVLLPLMLLLLVVIMSACGQEKTTGNGSDATSSSGSSSAEKK